MTLVGTSLVLWRSLDGTPERFVVDGRRYRVTDNPTPLEFDTALITHLDAVPTGWRLQGTDEAGESLMFDIGRFGDDHDWQVLRTYR
jgi:hypothetical protein